MIDNSKLIDMMETAVIIIDNKYLIQFRNKAAAKLIDGKISILEIINREYWPIFQNGVNNRFPFTVSEKRILKKPVINTTTESYRMIIKPISDELFFIELILLGSIHKRTSMLIKKNRDFIEHSAILSELIEIKSGGKSIKRMNSDDIIKTYEEQLKLQFAIDDAVTKTIEPIISGDLSIPDAANIVFSEIKQIVNCRAGVILANYGDGHYVVDRFDDDNILGYMKNYGKLYDNMVTDDKPFYDNTINLDDYDEEIREDLSHLSNIMIIPLIIDRVRYGFMLLANANIRFTSTHFKITHRLGQLFSLAFQRSEYLMQLEEQASIDQLTGCYNRRAGMARLNSLYMETHHSGKEFSLVFFDVNGLKKVNDTYGHDDGDYLIKSFTDVVKGITRGNDIFARFGGDEFILALPKCKIEMAEHLVERIDMSISDFNQTHDKPYDVSVSAGIVECNKDSDMTVKQLVNKADEIMYENKKIYKMRLKENENSACR